MVVRPKLIGFKTRKSIAHDEDKSMDKLNNTRLLTLTVSRGWLHFKHSLLLFLVN